MRATLLSLGLLLAPALCHFSISYPPERDIDEDNMDQFPCGGNNMVGDRTPWPITGGSPITIDNEHTSGKVEVLIAIGNDPGDAFHTVLVPTYEHMGPGDFCMGRGMITIPDTIAGVKIVDGVNATIQVQTDGEGGGGLYNCADITFTSTPLTESQYNDHCETDDGIITRPVSDGTTVNANGTSIAAGATVLGSSQDSSSGSSGGSGGDSGGDTGAASVSRAGLISLGAGVVAAVVAVM